MSAAGDFNVMMGLLALLPLVVYIILVFRDADPIPVTIICLLVGMIVSGQGPIKLGESIVKAMGSFLAVIGLIIMLGRGLGEVMTATKVSHTLVYKIVYGIGINTQKKAMLGIGASCFTLIALLGTMAGGNAILAPIVIPIAASVGLSRSTVGTIFDTVGEEALIVGPFTPPVITLLGLTGIAYAPMLLFVALPFVAATMIITWFNLQKIQRETELTNPYDQQDKVEAFEPTPQSNRATIVFVVMFIFAILYGIFKQAGTSFIVIIMLSLSLATGFAGGMNMKEICRHIVKGMAGNVNLFFLFVLLEPFLGFVEAGGGFKALAVLLQPIADMGGKAGVVLTGGLIGAFGISGAAVAQLKVMHSMFGSMITQQGISMFVWAAALIVGSRVTSFIYPGPNMFGAVGFAQSDDIKAVLRNGWMVSTAHCIILVIYAVVFA